MTYMKRSKKIFLIIAAIFLIIMMIIGYDISTRTTWPGAKKNLKERIEKDSEATLFLIQEYFCLCMS